jgi:hypothetical protein
MQSVDQEMRFFHPIMGGVWWFPRILENRVAGKNVDSIKAFDEHTSAFEEIYIARMMVRHVCRLRRSKSHRDIDKEAIRDCESP